MFLFKLACLLCKGFRRPLFLYNDYLLSISYFNCSLIPSIPISILINDAANLHLETIIKNDIGHARNINIHDTNHSTNGNIHKIVNQKSFVGHRFWFNNCFFLGR